MKAKEEVKELMKEIEGFKEKSELLHSNKFPPSIMMTGTYIPKSPS